MITQKHINLIYKKSKAYLLIEKINLYISQIIFSSFIYKIIFNKTRSEDFFNKSLIARILNFFIKIFLWPKKFFLEHNIYQNSFLKFFLDSIFSFNIPDFIFKSNIIKLLTNFLGLDIINLLAINKNKTHNKKSSFIKIFFWSGILILFFSLAKFISLKKSFFIISAIIFSLLVLNNTKLGVYALSLFFALLPTKFTLGLILLTLFSFAFNLFFNNKFSLNINLIDVFIILFSGLIFYSVFISYFIYCFLFCFKKHNN